MFLTPLLLLVLFSAHGQLDKKSWLVGGNGTFYSYNENYSSPFYSSAGKFTQIDLSPVVGYFVAPKLALGIRPSFSSIKGKITSNGGGSTNVQRYWIGPFVRYYFLDKEKPYNLLADAGYRFGVYNSHGQKGDLRSFNILAGPVIYFNTSVGIEFLLGYASSVESADGGTKYSRKGFQIGTGIQINLKN